MNNKNNHFLDVIEAKDAASGGITLSKVSSSEFDPIQEKNTSDIPAAKDTTTPASEDTNSRPQSVPVANPTSTTPVAVNQSQQYPRPPTTAFSYHTMPYPQQQYTFATSG